MPREIYNGIPIDHIAIMYDALIKEEIELDSDASIAFMQGCEYGYKKAVQQFNDEFESQLLYMGQDQEIKGIL